jgi:hypothetical protein
VLQVAILGSCLVCNARMRCGLNPLVRHSDSYQLDTDSRPFLYSAKVRRLSSVHCFSTNQLSAYITTVPAARDPSESPHRPIRFRVLGGRALTWCGHMAYLRMLYLERQGAVIMCYFTSCGVQYMLPRPRSQDQRRRWNDPDPKRRWARCYDGLASAPILRQLDSNTLTTPESVACCLFFHSFSFACSARAAVCRYIPERAICPARP